MSSKPKFCSQCGAAVETRIVDGQPCATCSACDTLAYQNPSPVAAVVVLNERREVLLVKCQRYSKTAQWCLPMDFAAAGETIADAARS